MSRALIAALTKLAQAPERKLASSSLTHSQQRELENFARKTGCVRRQIHGRGSVYTILDEHLLRQHLKHLSPASDFAFSSNLPARALNIARRRDSKSSAHQHDIYYLLLKAIEPDVIWRNDNDTFLDLSEATDQFGAAVLTLSREDSWFSEKPLWLVENQALFDQLLWLPSSPLGSVTFYSGQLSNLLIEWLAARPRASEIVLFPDYDGVGLANYARMLERGIQNCSFWLMPNWKRLLDEFGSYTVWENTLSEFIPAANRLAAQGAPTELLELIKYMQANSIALEQEAVWLNNQDQ